VFSFELLLRLPDVCLCMAKRRSIAWKFFELVEHGKAVKQAESTLCPDTTLTYAGGTSNLIHHLEAKHSVEYSKVKDGEMEDDKPAMKQLSLEVGPSTHQPVVRKYTQLYRISSC